MLCCLCISNHNDLFKNLANFRENPFESHATETQLPSQSYFIDFLKHWLHPHESENTRVTFPEDKFLEIYVNIRKFESGHFYSMLEMMIDRKWNSYLYSILWWHLTPSQILYPGRCRHTPKLVHFAVLKLYDYDSEGDEVTFPRCL
jgi:hypothetical protein